MKKPSTSYQPQRKKNQRGTHQSKPSAAGSVRIIGGQLKRRHVGFIDSDGLRPTPDRLRETLFNWLINDIHGARVLDCFAGSGVLGIEALSRGAAHTTFIEQSVQQAKLLQNSCEQLRLPNDTWHVFTGDAISLLSAGTDSTVFDIVFIDPPYAKDLWQPILTTLITHSLIDANTLLYIETDKTLDEQTLRQFEVVKQTKVGQAIAGLYRLVAS